MSQGTILLTGATGFVGSHVLELLIQSGHRVAILKRSHSDTWRISKILNDSAVYDMDQVSLESPFVDNEISGIIHTATCYGRQDEDPSEVLKANMLLPLSLLELAARFKTDFFINTDTFYDPSYGQLRSYARSKKQFLDWMGPFGSQMRTFNLRLQHVFGEKDDSRKFISWIIEELLSGREEIRLTPGEQERDFLYVRDAAGAYLRIVDEASNFRTGSYSYDICTGKATRIKTVVAMIKEITGNGQTVLNYGALPYREGERMVSKADPEGARRGIGWVSKTTLREGLARTVAWHVHQKSGGRPTASAVLSAERGKPPQVCEEA